MPCTDAMKSSSKPGVGHKKSVKALDLDAGIFPIAVKLRSGFSPDRDDETVACGDNRREELIMIISSAGANHKFLRV